MTKIIAEIGWNHIGNLNLAKKMILAAKKSGADLVKIQTFSEKDLFQDPGIMMVEESCIKPH